MSHFSYSSEGTSEDLIKNIEKRRQQRQKEQLNVGWYFWLLSENPALVIFLCVTFSIVLSVIGIFFTNLPDFSKPDKGFEVRGSELANKLVTWTNMRNHTGYNTTLSNFPTLYIRRKARLAEKFNSNSHRKKDNRKKRKKERGRNGKKNKRKRLRKRRSVDPTQSTSYHWSFQQNGYFCRNPNVRYSRVVYHSSHQNARSLWSVEGLLSICRSEKRLLSTPTYGEFCFRSDRGDGCCPTLSLPNYVAYLGGLDRCENITERSLRSVEEILTSCSPHYCSGSLTGDCWNGQTNDCPEIPDQCVENNAVYSLLFFLVPSSVACSNLSLQTNFNHNLRRTVVFLPAYANHKFLPMYEEIASTTTRSKDHVTEIKAMEFGLREDLFAKLLFQDMLYPAVAMSLVLLIIWIYTDSLFVTISSSLIAASAMCISYFLYSIVFNYSFFPFMNLAALLVMVGLSADNVLVFHSAWRAYAAEDQCKVCPAQRLTKSDYPLRNRIGVVMKRTMGHVAWSLFVTSFTTAAAFLSNCFSYVTAIKCFGVYTGITVLANLFLTLTWLPAAIVLHHKYLRCSNCSDAPQEDKKPSLRQRLVAPWRKIKKIVGEMSRVFFHQIQVLLIVRLRYIWIFLYLALFGASLYVVFKNPGLRLPTTRDMPYFKPTHPFQMYVKEKEHFAFESSRNDYMYVHVVFGIKPRDSGDHTNPDHLGPLTFQTRFNISSFSSQRWLWKFCHRLQKAPFYRALSTQERSAHCFIESFVVWMRGRRCTAESPVCCSKQKFPYRPHVFDKCLKEALYAIKRQGANPNEWTGGPRYDALDMPRALVVVIPTVKRFTASFNEMEEFYKEVDSFVSPLLDEAPRGLYNGWFAGDFYFYSLQKGLYQGTLTSVGISLLIVQAVILITSRNLLVAVLANFSVGCIIMVTSAALVLLGWEFNVLESVTISIAVGLAVDFTLHYAVAYILAPASDDRQQRVEFAVSRMGSPITIAALTTCVAGVGMLPAQVVVYNNFGVFLTIVMAVSWLYSNYLFLPLLSAIGPQGSCGDLRCKSCCSAVAMDSDEHPTLMTETSSVKVTSTPPASSRNLVVMRNQTEIIERSTVI